MIWFTLILLFLLGAILAGLESALSSIPAARLRHKAQRSKTGNREIVSLLNRRSSLLLVTVLLGQTFHLLALALLARICLLHLDTAGFLVAFAAYLPLQVLVGQVCPKAVFPHLPLSALLLLSRPILLLQWMLNPLIRLAGQLPRPRSGPSPDQERDTFLELTNLAAEEGTLTAEETAIIRQTLEFDRVAVSSLMLPLRKVTAIPAGMPITTVLHLARDTELNQFPVTGEQGDFIALVRVFELLKAGESAQSLRPFLRDLIRIPGDTKALQALQSLRLSRTEIGLVTGPRDRPLGIVSTYDIVQSLISAEFGEKSVESR